MISVSLAAAEPTHRSALQAALGTVAHFLILDTCATAAEARKRLATRPPQVALIDLALADGDGTAVIDELAPRFPQTAFIVVTAADDPASILASLRAGAVGYLLRTATSTAQLCAAIEEAHRGGAPLSPAVARRVVASFTRHARPAPADVHLTAREREVLTQLSTGATYRAIGRHLGIAEDTVRVHIRGLYGKLRVNSRTAAVLKHLGVP
jgi:DNA-binding NarL/FixJ family response regulator